MSPLSNSSSARSTGRSLVAVLTLALVLGARAPIAAGPDSGVFVAQAQPGRTREPLRLQRGGSRPSGASARTPAADSSSANATTPAGDDTPAAAPPKGFVASLKSWVRDYAVWIVSLLACAIAGVFLWVFLGRSRSDAGDDVFAPLDDGESSSAKPGTAGRRYSTTRIHARDVNDRLASTEVEADRDYALVVDEEALKRPEIDENTGRVYEDSTQIEHMIRDEKFDEAYEAYIERVEADADAEFHEDVERALGEHYLQQREFDRATRVFEHMVATHAATSIDAATYFNLGYLHFFGERKKKSRRFFKLYVENETNATRADRARKILDHMETAGPMS